MEDGVRFEIMAEEDGALLHTLAVI